MVVARPVPTFQTPSIERSSSASTIGVHDVAHVHEVALLFAVAVDLQRLPGREPVGEDG